MNNPFTSPSFVTEVTREADNTNTQIPAHILFGKLPNSWMEGGRKCFLQVTDTSKQYHCFVCFNKLILQDQNTVSFVTNSQVLA
jgi:hypothetical protein